MCVCVCVCGVGACSMCLCLGLCMYICVRMHESMCECAVMSGMWVKRTVNFYAVVLLVHQEWILFPSSSVSLFPLPMHEPPYSSVPFPIVLVLAVWIAHVHHETICSRAQ